MRRIIHKFNFTHMLDDERVMTGEMFDSERFAVTYARNKEWYAEAARQYDPNYAAREIRKMEVQRAEKRKAELEEQMRKIQEELART